MSAEATRARLERYVVKYNPEKISAVPHILEKFKGREDVLFATLIGKYGPEPPSPDDQVGDTTTNRLERFFAKYVPEKISLVPQILETFKGREEALFASLVGKFGPEPTATSVRNADKNLRSRAPPVTAADSKIRLERFYVKHNPEKISIIPQILEVYKGREDVLFATLVAKYGPEPETAPAAALSTPAERSTGFFVKRLTRVFRGHVIRVICVSLFVVVLATVDLPIGFMPAVGI